MNDSKRVDMLWKQLNPSYRKLMRRGLQGEAVIVRAEEERQKGRIGGIFGWHLTIRVKFADDSSAEFKRYVDAAVLSFDGGGPARSLEAGMVVPIRFDPSKQSRVEIDTKTLRSQETARRSQDSADAEKTQDAKVLKAEQNLRPITSQPPPPPE